MKNKQIVILADGSFPQHPRPLKILEEASTVICCDSAADTFIAAGRTPDVIIGDLDSLSENARKKFADRLIEITEQESNDLTKAVSYCIDKGYKEVIILGATGKREDHTLGNISLLLEYNKHIKAITVTDYVEISLLGSGVPVASYPGEKISFFSTDSNLKVTSTGLKYPLKEMLLHNWWRATLNEVTEDEFTLFFDSGVPLLLFRVHPE